MPSRCSITHTVVAGAIWATVIKQPSNKEESALETDDQIVYGAASLNGSGEPGVVRKQLKENKAVILFESDQF